MTKIVIHNHLPRGTKDVHAFEHALPREQEERNRDSMYRDTGITRVSRDAKKTVVVRRKRK
jgi:hypothetical protein